MDKSKKILILILIAIPVLFILFLLAVINVLYLFLAIIALLAGVVLLKKFKPEFFQKSKPPEPISTSPTNSDRPHDRAQVYMVLAGSEDFGVRRIAVNKTYYRIGRAVDNDFVIDSKKISRHHMKIEFNAVENACYAIDSGSSNGTYLNNVRMIEGQRYKLAQGDRLMIDERIFVVNYAHY
ncbi:MAG: FHA domain-containing protein [Clostridia bacterium]|nr:FHA domain-containing protein [Clostridia bacterium]MBQ4158994.1 FHA domain-containing protein [Clostridia bacterium]